MWFSSANVDICTCMYIINGKNKRNTKLEVSTASNSKLYSLLFALLKAGTHSYTLQLTTPPLFKNVVSLFAPTCITSDKFHARFHLYGLSRVTLSL